MVVLFLAFFLIFWPCMWCACWILGPQPGIKSWAPTVEAWSLNHWTVREVSIFRFLKNHHTVFHSGFANLCSHQQCTGVPFPPNPLQTFVICRVLMALILTGVRWYLIVVLICISLIVSHIKYIFICLLARVSMSSLEKCLFRFSAQFFIILFIFLILSCMCFCIIWILTYRWLHHS